MSKRYTRNPGADQIKAWKAAIAAHRKQQRQWRGRRVMQDASRIGPGMIRRPPSTEGGSGDGDHDDGPWHD
jgi:hypothetical protein